MRVRAVMTNLISLVVANIQGIAIPKTIKPGHQFDAVFICNDNSQPADEVAAAFGVAPRNSTTSLGTVLGSVYIGSATEHMLTVSFITALFRVDSEKSIPRTELSKINVAIGNKTSDEYVSTYTFVGQNQ